MPTLEQLKNSHIELLENIYGFPSSASDSNLLYHYTTVNALEAILTNGGIRISNAKFLNDSEEIKYTIDLISDTARTVFNDNEFFLSQISEIIGKMLTKLNNIYIWSLTTNRDSLALWSNYSNCEGYCLGFNNNELFESLHRRASINLRNPDGLDNPKKNIIGNEVIYSKDFQIKYLSEKLYMIHDYALDINDVEYNDYLHNQLYESIAASFAIGSMFFKSPVFVQEEEYRYVFTVRDNLIHKNMVNYRVSNGVLIPYISLVFNNKKLPLQSVCIGPKNHSDLAELGLKSFLESLDYNEIDIYKSGLTLRY